MHLLSASQFLDLWEAGLAQPPLNRAIALLAAAFPGTPPETLAALPIGQRDAHLLTLRARTFGPRLNSLANCPVCGERLELAFDTDDIREDIRAGEVLESGGDPDTMLSLTLDDYTVSFRLPNSLDLAALSNLPTETNLRQQLLLRCLSDTTYKDKPCHPEQLPPQLIEALVEKMAAADPQADVQLALTCPACGHRWQAAFDILTFFWTEIHGWAQRTLREIHLLASVYGWSEREILALTPLRRAMYLQMVAL